MKFGVREICDVVFKAKAATQIGQKVFQAGEPVLLIDTAKTSTLEGASTTVYAQGGKGNSRLLAWEGERTLTFTVEDALLSTIGFSVLSGAGVFNGKDSKNRGSETVHVHKTGLYSVVSTKVTISTSTGETFCKTAPIFVMGVESDGSINGDVYTATVGTITEGGDVVLTLDGDSLPSQVFVDYYVIRKSDNKYTELQIDAGTFGGYYYVEASTLFRDENTGKDLPAEVVLPKVKVQSNFTFSMSSSGDPSTFTFTMDAFPDTTIFDKNNKVLCAIQIIGDAITNDRDYFSVFGHVDNEILKTEEDAIYSDSVTE